jgi:hypothetical protein
MVRAARFLRRAVNQTAASGVSQSEAPVTRPSRCAVIFVPHRGRRGEPSRMGGEFLDWICAFRNAVSPIPAHPAGCRQPHSRRRLSGRRGPGRSGRTAAVKSEGPVNRGRAERSHDGGLAGRPYRRGCALHLGHGQRDAALGDGQPAHPVQRRHRQLQRRGHRRLAQRLRSRPAERAGHLRVHLRRAPGGRLYVSRHSPRRTGADRCLRSSMRRSSAQLPHQGCRTRRPGPAVCR